MQLSLRHLHARTIAVIIYLSPAANTIAKITNKARLWQSNKGQDYVNLMLLHCFTLIMVRWFTDLVCVRFASH